MQSFLTVERASPDDLLDGGDCSGVMLHWTLLGHPCSNKSCSLGGALTCTDRCLHSLASALQHSTADDTIPLHLARIKQTCFDTILF